MKLRRLCKSEDSVPQGKCPAVYIADDPSVVVAQGKILDDPTTTELLDLADDERGVALPTETVLRAAALILAERGRSDVVHTVEEVLESGRPPRP